MVQFNLQQLQLRSPRQATNVFGYNNNNWNMTSPETGVAVPRPKNLFYTKFVKGVQTQTTDNWAKSIGFAVKSVDRPTLSPVAEELNQYNKKRQVYTGYKLNPVNISFHDTADSNLLRMWNEYTKWYFGGDFAYSNQSPWSYDVTSAFFNNPGNGFGYSPQMASGGLGDNYPFFFERIEIYQFYGGLFMQTNLINPKITAFDPDDLNYEESSSASIKMTLVYEAVQYVNNNHPASIGSRSDLVELFQNQFFGNVYDPTGYTIGNIVSGIVSDLVTGGVNTLATAVEGLFGVGSSQITVGQSGNVFDAEGNILGVLDSVGNFTNLSGNIIASTAVGGGALSAFGNFSFGTGSPSTFNNNSLNNVMSTTFGNIGGTLAGTAAQVGVASLLSRGAPANSAVAGISGVAYDAALGALGSSVAGNVSSLLSRGFAAGIMSTSLQQGNSPLDQVNTNNGLALNPDSLATINDNRPAYSQIGMNYSGTGSFGVLDDNGNLIDNSNSGTTTTVNGNSTPSIPYPWSNDSGQTSTDLSQIDLSNVFDQ